jgi:hypothetical protein
MNVMPASMPYRLKVAEQERTAYFWTATPGTVVEDILTRDYWQHVENQLRINDVIDVVAADGSFDVTIRLVRKAPGFLGWRVIRDWQSQAVETNDGKFSAKWLGPAAKWCVVESASGKKLADGLDKAAAMADVQRRSTLEAT